MLMLIERGNKGRDSMALLNGEQHKEGGGEEMLIMFRVCGSVAVPNCNSDDKLVILPLTLDG